jgi:Uma2 family endonuclease
MFVLHRCHYGAQRSCLRGTSCRAFIADAKLRIARSGAFYYPDVMVTCDLAISPLATTTRWSRHRKQ